MTRIDELLNNWKFNFPRKVDNGGTFGDFLKIHFGEYLDFQNRIEGPDEITQHFRDNSHVTQGISKAIRDSVYEANRGRPGEALRIFSIEMNKHKDLFKSTMFRVMGGSTRLFRIRKSEIHLENYSDLFHIPFELRHQVGTQRFSIPGRPALYLGGSIYVSWLELGRPELSKIYVSEFEANTNATVIDFCYDFRRLENIWNLYLSGKADKVDIRLMKGTLVFWPLIVACSLKRRYAEGKFHYEYIIPHLLAEWMECVEADGIRYLSTMLSPASESGEESFNKSANYFFPTRDSMEQGHCSRLCLRFSMTPPFPYDIIKTIRGSFDEEATIGGVKVEIGRHDFVPYNKTEFYIVECNLKHRQKVDCYDSVKRPDHAWIARQMQSPTH